MPETLMSKTTGHIIRMTGMLIEMLGSLGRLPDEQ